MAFTWEGRYVLRRIDEDDSDFHRIYKHSADPAEITDADNVFTGAPALASKRLYSAERIDSKAQWEVALWEQPNVWMAVFVLVRLP